MRPFLFKTSSGRIWELDFFRGCMILLMFLAHFLYDLMLFGTTWSFAVPAWAEPANAAWRFLMSDDYTFFDSVIVFGFFAAAGVSSSLTRSGWMHGLKVLGFAFVVSLCSGLVGMVIRFGVLHALGVCMLFEALLRSLKANKIVVGVLAALFLLAGLYPMSGAPLPEVLRPYDWFFEVFGWPIGVYDDYTPLIPHLGLFLLGSLAGRTVYAQKRSLAPAARPLIGRPIEFLGRHSLPIYVTHQLILFGLFTAFSLISSLPLPF